jgi:CheY-like chemotaxis protein
MMPGAERQWRILLVEDDEPLAITTTESLQRRPISSSGEFAMVEHVLDFGDAMRQIEDRRYDLIILDIRDQTAARDAQLEGVADESGDDVTPADKGLELYSEIRSRRFLPIVFYSAVAHLAEHLHDPPFVTVISKLSDEENLLRHQIVEVFDSRLPLLNRSLARHVDYTLRDFMIGFVEENWAQIIRGERRADLAYLMARRLARSLDATFVAELAGTGASPSDEKSHPTRLYIMPPLSDAQTGDIVRDGVGDWLVVLTPACDLVKRSGRMKAEFVVVADCLLLTDSEEYRKWVDAGFPDSGGRFNQLIANNREGQRDRYYFLPAAWGLPDLIVDLQRISHVSAEEFEGMRRVATLDDPYAQAIVAQLGRYSGRVGTPDLDLQAVRERIRPARPDVEAATAGSPLARSVGSGASTEERPLEARPAQGDAGNIGEASPAAPAPEAASTEGLPADSGASLEEPPEVDPA